MAIGLLAPVIMSLYGMKMARDGQAATDEGVNAANRLGQGSSIRSSGLGLRNDELINMPSQITTQRRSEQPGGMFTPQQRMLPETAPVGNRSASGAQVARNPNAQGWVQPGQMPGTGPQFLPASMQSPILGPAATQPSPNPILPPVSQAPGLPPQRQMNQNPYNGAPQRQQTRAGAQMADPIQRQMSMNMARANIPGKLNPQQTASLNSTAAMNAPKAAPKMVNLVGADGKNLGMWPEAQLHRAPAGATIGSATSTNPQAAKAPSAYELKASRLRADYPGISGRDVNDIIDGRISIKPISDPVTGKTDWFRVDNVSQQIEPLQVSGGGVAAPNGAPSPQVVPGEPTSAVPDSAYTAPLLSQVGELGGLGWLEESLAAMTIGGYDAGQETTVPRQQARLFKQALYGMYGGPKMSNQDKKELDSTLTGLGFFQSPETSYDKLATWEGRAQTILRDQTNVMNNDNLPAELRQNAAGQVQGARDVISIIGNPREVGRPGGLRSISNIEEYNNLPPGPYIDPNGIEKVKK